LSSKFIQTGNQELPFTNLDVLQMFIAFGNNKKKGNKSPISLFVENDGKITIRGLFDASLGKINEDGSL